MAEPQMELLSGDDEDRLRRKLLREMLTWEGTAGIDTDGTLTEEGIDRLLRFFRAEGYGIVKL